MNQSGEENATIQSGEENATTQLGEQSAAGKSALSLSPFSSSLGPVIVEAPSTETPATVGTGKKIVPVLKRKRAASPQPTEEGESTEGAVTKRFRPDEGLGEAGVRRKKRVVFDGVTVFFFRRMQGFTSVPSQGGSTLGMSSRHENIGKFTLKQFAQSQERTHRAILRKQLMDRRCQQLKDSAPCSTVNLREAESDLDGELDNININDYYFLQPIPTKQRRLLLRRAGVKKIDNTEKTELKEIRHSRESCGCDCQMVCNPETCMCSLAGIKCQVDRQSFPCGCTKDGCQNDYGRIEFNPSRVRTHFIHTLMRLDMEQRQIERENPGADSDREMGEGPPDISSLSSPLEDWVHQPSTSSSSMYSGSLNGRDFYGNGEHPGGDDPTCTSSLYPKSCDAYGSGNSLEENIPVEVHHSPRQHDLIPQMLQFNESEDESTLTQPIAPLCNVPLPTMPCYDSSEDNLSSSSDSSSSSEASSNYELNETCTPFDFKSSADYNLASSLVQSPEVNSPTHSSTVDGSLPHLTPLEVSNVFSRRQAENNMDSKMYTELKQPNSYASGSFTSGLYTPDNSAHSSYSDMFMSYESPKVAESLPLTLSSLAPEPLSYTTCSSPTTSSTYTVMSSLNVVDSLTEMQETAIATSKLSTVTFGAKDDSNPGFVPPEPLLTGTSSAVSNSSSVSTSSSLVPGCKERDSNEATPAVSSVDNRNDGESPRDPVLSLQGGCDATDSALQETPIVCSSTEAGQMFPTSEASICDKESTDTCSAASSPSEAPPQDAASNVDNQCCSSSELQGGVGSESNVFGSVASKAESFVRDTSVHHANSPQVTHTPSPHIQNQEMCTSDETVDTSDTQITVNKRIASTINAKVQVLSQLPTEALVDSATDLASKIQVLRSNSEGDATPSISPDSMSPDGALSDDPFKQVIDPTAIDESSFSSSDSAVGHMTGHVAFNKITSSLPFVEAGLSE